MPEKDTQFPQSTFSTSGKRDTVAPALIPFDARHAALDDDEGLLPADLATEVRRVRATARQDVRRLLTMTPAEREERVVEAEGRRSFRSRALAEMLLEESRRLLPEGAADAENLARVAGLVVHWTPGPLGERWRAGVQARVAAHRANAWRVAGRLELAAEIFRRLDARLVTGGVAEPLPFAEAAAWRAAYELRRGEPGPASRLLAVAVDRYRQLGARVEVARCLVRHAEVAALAGEPGTAVDSLEWAVRVYGIAAHAADRRPVELRLAHALLDAGEEEAAGETLASALASGPGDSDDDGARVPELDRDWVEARLGGRAEELTAVRDRLLAEGRVADAVTAAFAVP
ncbi:MAG TPA: hypothetical protein VKU40_07855, partial [Thermoanaerobaculia bacterium]|nr:hypothetical protein [Thermoanaerobaculia bacterium]